MMNGIPEMRVDIYVLFVLIERITHKQNTVCMWLFCLGPLILFCLNFQSFDFDETKFDIYLIHNS